MEKKAVKILFVDSNKSGTMQVVRELKKNGIYLSFLRIETYDEFREQISAFNPDVIIAEYLLPGWDGLKALKTLRAGESHVPFIIYTAKGNESVAVEFMKCGADDYLNKNTPGRIADTVSNALDKAVGQKQKSVSADLMANAERLRQIINSAQDAVILTDAFGKISYWNPAAERIFGYKPGECLGTDPHYLIATPQIKNDEEEAMTHFMATGEGRFINKTIEVIAKHKEGWIFPVEISLSPIYYENGYGAVAIIRDIAERKKAAEEISRKESQFSALIELAGDAIFVADFNSALVILANEQACKSLGYTKEELFQKTIYEFDSVFGEKKIQFEFWSRMVPGKIETIEVLHQRKDGSVFPVEVRTTLIDFDGHKSVLGIARDITERKNAEADLRMSENRFRTLFEESGDFIFILEPSIEKGLPIIDANEAACRFHGYSREELTGKAMFSLDVDIIEQPVTHLFDQLKSGEQIIFERKHRKKNGSEFYVEISAKLAESRNGSSIIISREIDITDRKNAEEKLLQSEKNYRLLYENSPIGIYIASPQGQLLNVNQAALDMLGSPSEEAMRQINLLTYSSLVETGYSGKFKECVESGKTVQMELLYTSKWDKQVYMSSFLVPLKDAQGRVEKVYTFMQDISERKKAEYLLTRSIERWESLFNNSPNSIAIYSAVDNGQDFIFNDFNPMAEKVDKIDRQQVIGKRVTEVFPSVAELGFLEAFRRVWKTGKTEVMNNINYRDKRLEGWRENIIYRLNTGEVVTIFNDISDRKKAEQDLQNSLAENKALLSANPDLMFVFDRNCCILQFHVNKAGLYTDPGNFLYRPVDEILPPDVVKLTHEKVDYVLSTGELTTGSYSLEKDGVTSFFESRYVLLNQDKVLAIVRDITDRVKAEFNLLLARKKTEESEEQLKVFINSIPDIICFKDGHGRWLMANQSDLELFCLTNVDYFSKTDAELADYTDEIYREAFLYCMNTDEKAWLNITTSHGIEIIPTISGEKKVFDVIKTPIFYPNGERKALAVVGRNITELYHAQKELEIAKNKAEGADRLKTAFLQNMSHEIRTPLNAIEGFSDMLTRNELSEEKKKNFVSIIRNSSRQLLSIVSDILTIASLETRQEKINTEQVCVNEMIINLLAIFKQQSVNQNVSLFTRQTLSDAQSEIHTDKTKLTQILSNLVSNALKFTHEGFVEFGYTLKEPGQDSSMKSPYLEFFVKDSGIGIKSELHEKIFERFLQADLNISKKYGGTGLGLSISKGFVELLGGSIWVESIPGQGSSFFFTIPYVPVHNAGSHGASAEKQSASGKTILVAEDDEFNFLLIRELLNRSGLQIIHARDGQEVIDLFKQNPEVRLILMDIKMPVMEGHEAARIIRQMNANIPIIAQSAYAMDYEIEKYGSIFDNYLTKPLDGPTLKKTIARYIQL